MHQVMKDYDKESIFEHTADASDYPTSAPAVIRAEPLTLPMRIMSAIFGLLFGTVVGFVGGFIQAFFVTPALLTLGVPVGPAGWFANDTALFEVVLRGGVYVLTPSLALLFGWFGWRGRGFFSNMLNVILSGILGLGLAVLVALGFIDGETQKYGTRQKRNS
jgi:hypothetical protein